MTNDEKTFLHDDLSAAVLALQNAECAASDHDDAGVMLAHIKVALRNAEEALAFVETDVTGNGGRA